LADGQNFYATGHRKNATAKVWLVPGSGAFTVNGRPMPDYLQRRSLELIVMQPLRLVEAEGQPAAAWTDEIDLHHDRHRPCESLVDAEQHVGRDDPGPARCHRDQQRHRQRGHPPGDQQASPADARRKRARAKVREGLGEPERDDERQHCGARPEAELVAADERQR